MIYFDDVDYFGIVFWGRDDLLLGCFALFDIVIINVVGKDVQTEVAQGLGFQEGVVLERVKNDRLLCLSLLCQRMLPLYRLVAVPWAKPTWGWSNATI